MKLTLKWNGISRERHGKWMLCLLNGIYPIWIGQLKAISESIHHFMHNPGMMSVDTEQKKKNKQKILLIRYWSSLSMNLGHKAYHISQSTRSMSAAVPNNYERHLSTSNTSDIGVLKKKTNKQKKTTHTLMTPDISMLWLTGHNCQKWKSK